VGGLGRSPSHHTFNIHQILLFPTRSSNTIGVDVPNSRENLRFRRKNTKVSPEVGDAPEATSDALQEAAPPPEVITVPEGKLFARKKLEARANISIMMTKKERLWRENPRWQVENRRTGDGR
jgi:hypothetical protein